MRVKEGGCEEIWGGGGTQADLERLLHTEGWVSAGDTREMPKAFRTRRQESRVRMREVRAETEQEEPLHYSNRGRGRRRTDLV